MPRDKATPTETNVLLADDDDDDFLFFTLAVADTQIAVALTRVEDGEMLMKALEENIPDVLFLDLHMPCKNGWQCLREIRSNRRYDNLPIITYTSFDDLKNIDYCFREGANLYSVKATNLASLTEILKRVLSIEWKRTMYFPPRQEFVLQPS
ncbi:response regulator [Parachryseolinea silvisoli]|uniref:response regulator n=1 Tax=Parachryseolinea silvisoli TaxID=2873601 RepID=UPI002265AD40|nr:response regulator [Parachryseolinea silvisoli]MCD9015169.1 response regulator [Parachryseolinea silvisoli]